MDNGKVLTGQLYERDSGLVIPFTEQTQNTTYGAAVAAIGNAGTEVTPHDANSSLVRVFDPTALAAAYAAIHFAVANKTRLDLPDELTAITLTFNDSRGEGSETQIGDVAAIGTSVSGSLSLPAHANSSISLIPELSFTIKPWSEWAKATPTMEYYFYLPGDVTYAAVKTRVATLVGEFIADWPAFRPMPLMIVASGKQVSLTASASIHQSVSVGPTDAALMWTGGVGSSFEVGNSSRTFQVPPTIHDHLTIESPTLTTSISASAAVSWPIETNWPARSESTTVASGDVTAGISPSDFPATSPITVPTAGHYLYDYQVKPDKDGQNRVLAVVVDMSYFA